MADVKWSAKGDKTPTLLDDFMLLTDPDGTPDNGTANIADVLALDKGQMAVSLVTADANITGAVGTLHVVDMNDGSTPFTATREYRLPTTFAVGDRAGVYIQDGDATHKVLTYTTAASGDTIDGTDHSATEQAHLFQTGELQIFRGIVANTAWIREIDGRIGTYGELIDTGSQTLTQSAYNQIEFTTVVRSAGVTTDVATTWDITVRRAGRYHLQVSCYVASLAADVHLAIMARIDATVDTVPIHFYGPPGASLSTSGGTYSQIIELDDGEAVSLWPFLGDTTNRATASVNPYLSRMVLEEILP